MNMIVAFTADTYGIGYKGKLPWPHLSQDMKHFREMTMGKTVVMGFKTWLSLECKPLKGRKNIVVSREKDPDRLYPCFIHDEDLSKELGVYNDIMIIGGASLYDKYIGKAKNIFATIIYDSFECDTFFPGEMLLDKYHIVERSELLRDNNIDFRFVQYKLNV